MILADPVGSVLAPLVKTGQMTEAGSWAVEGIGEDFVPPNCDLSLVKDAYSIPDPESFAAARDLLRTEGLFGGSSSGTYAITGKPSSNVVTIDSDLAGSFPLDSATFDTARVSLPDDFGRLEKVFGVNSFTRSAFPASTVELMHLDTYALTQNNFVTGYTLEWNQATTTSAPVPTLKIWPQPDSANFEALAAIYYRKWPELSGDADTVPIPEYMELLFITAMRAIAMGYDGGSTLDAALAQIRAGDIWQAAVREDGAGQRLAGPVMFRAVRGDSTDGQDPLAGVRTEALFDS